MHGTFTSSAARFYSACVSCAFAWLHGLKIAYRDLKPENLLIDEKGYIKVRSARSYQSVDCEAAA